jgi:hypothetical protein
MVGCRSLLPQNSNGTGFVRQSSEATSRRCSVCLSASEWDVVHHAVVAPSERYARHLVVSQRNECFEASPSMRTSCVARDARAEARQDTRAHRHERTCYIKTDDVSRKVAKQSLIDA